MKVTQKQLIKNNIFITMILVIGFILISTYISYSGIQNATKSSELFSTLYLEENMSMVKNEVEKRLGEIVQEREIIYQLELDAVKHEITHLGYILSVSDLVLIEDPIERRNAAVRKYEKMVDFDHKYLFFALSPNGNVLKSSIDSTIQGTNMWDFEDINGDKFIQKIVEAVDREEGVYVDYFWPMEQGGEPLKKTAFCIYIPEFDMIIGSGIYEAVINQELENKTYKRLQNYYEEHKNYIFITGYDGVSRVAGNKEVVGQNLSEVLNVDGRRIQDIFMEKVATEGEGFVTYTYYKKDSDVKSEKTTYVVGIDEWQVYIGMGFHTDDLMHVTEQYDEKFKQYHYTEIVFVIVGLMLITLIVLILVRRGARLEKKYLHQEEAIFTQLFKISDEGILILEKDGTALYRNDVVDKVFGYEIGRFIVNGQLILPNVNESTFLLQNSAGRSYYVEINSNQVYYHGTDSMIYFLKDVTEQYLLANEYERMSLLDELTGLSNRRALSNYFEDACFDESKQNEVLLAIIDLDYFKDVNDQYGHDVGDRVIQILGEVFTDRLRGTDQFYRYGGEEFIAVLSAVDIESGKELLEEINKRFDVEVLNELSFNCTFSGGLIQIDWSEGCSLSHYIRQADRLLYKAKDNGRKRIEI